MLADVRRTNPNNGRNYDIARPSRFGNPPTVPTDDSNSAPIAGDPNWASRPRALHTDGCNVAWLDGHVKWSRTTSFFYGQNPVDKYFDTQ